jgi:hypothetical protein
VHEHQDSGILQWAMHRLESLDHYRTSSKCWNPARYPPIEFRRITGTR